MHVLRNNRPRYPILVLHTNGGNIRWIFSAQDCFDSISHHYLEQTENKLNLLVLVPGCDTFLPALVTWLPTMRF